MYLHNLIGRYLGDYSDFAWTVYAAAVLLIAFGIYWLQRIILARLCERLSATHHSWDDTLFIAMRKPFGFFIWFVSLTLTAQYIFLDFEQMRWMSVVIQTRKAGLVVILVWFIWRYIACLEQRLLDKHYDGSDEKTTVSIVGRLLRIALLVIACLMLLDSYGIPLTGLLAFGGGGAIAVGIAAQDLLANLFGGLMIFMDKPFKLGEWISSPDRNIEGTVQEIGWRITKVMTFEKRPLYIPNSVFSKIVIVNPGRMSNRRIKQTVGLRYDDSAKVELVVNDIRKMLHAHKGIDQAMSLMVHFVNFGPSSLDIDIYCFTKTTIWALWRDIQQEIFLNVLSIVEKHGAQVAFPTSTFHVPDGLAIKGEK